MTKQRVRVIFKANGFRSIIWIDESNDNSIYFGLSDPLLVW